jgi:hypothetical protein
MAANQSRIYAKKYLWNGLLLILPIWFLYQSLTPKLVPAWPSKQHGDFAITPTPLDLKDPYQHHAQYVKDFSFQLASAHIAQIRQGYANLGPAALPLAILEAGEQGILHGHAYGLHAHAIAPSKLSASDKLWLTIQTWQGQTLVLSWDLPPELLRTTAE